MTKSDANVYDNALRMFERKCALCGSPNVQLHHIRYGGNYGGRKTYDGNVIPLCHTHHNEVHTNKGKWMPILIRLYGERAAKCTK